MRRLLVVMTHPGLLRAAAHRLGNHAAVETLTPRVLELAKRLGIDPPERFNNRYDLLRFWRMVPDARP